MSSTVETATDIGHGVQLATAAWKTSEISLPVPVTIFQEDLYRPPWVRPQPFSEELRAAFKPLWGTQ